MVSARKRKNKRRLTLPRIPATPKPRSPLVAPAALRKAGAHRKPASALRRASKMALKKLAGEA